MVVALAAACGAPVRPAEPVVTAGPDELTLREIRRDAAFYLNCQVPAVLVELGPWSGSQGNVIASGCGFMLHYYVVCQSPGHCGYTVAD